MGVWPYSLRHTATLVTPRVEPEEIVAPVADLSGAEKRVGCGQSPLCLVDLSRKITVKYASVTRRKGVDAALPLLPSRRSAKQITVPCLIEQRFAVVVP